MNLIISGITLGAVLLASSVRGQDWTEKTITPVANPIFFESPFIQSEVRPLFAWHRLDRGFLGVDVDVRVYAVQLRYAVNDRLAIIATKDGYIEFDPQGLPGADGWADIGLGFKYALYRDDDRQIIVTPGLTFEIPTGNQNVFQGNGSGEANVFVSAAKGWDNLHATVNLGARIPMDMSQETASVRYGAMLDYYTCKWFIPFATIIATTTLNSAGALPFASEGFDLINFGSSNAAGTTQVACGVGFRSRVHKRVDIGFAYERGFEPANDIFKDRFTVDLVWRF
ncbi:MAG: hypothetical protein AB1705_03890 [Verrucomicrobiota bacterium]